MAVRVLWTGCAILTLTWVLVLSAPTQEEKQFVDNHTYYEVLGVPRDSTKAEIRKAYRKLAIQYHPDKADNEVDTTEMFSKINEAYEVLGDDETRKLYDQFGDAYQFADKIQKSDAYKNFVATHEWSAEEEAEAQAKAEKRRKRFRLKPSLFLKNKNVRQMTTEFMHFLGESWSVSLTGECWCIFLYHSPDLPKVSSYANDFEWVVNKMKDSVLFGSYNCQNDEEGGKMFCEHFAYISEEYPAAVVIVSAEKIGSGPTVDWMRSFTGYYKNDIKRILEQRIKNTVQNVNSISIHKFFKKPAPLKVLFFPDTKIKTSPDVLLQTAKKFDGRVAFAYVDRGSRNALSQQYGVTQYPAIAFVTDAGSEVRTGPDILNADKLEEIINFVGSKQEKRTKREEL